MRQVALPGDELGAFVDELRAAVSTLTTLLDRLGPVAEAFRAEAVSERSRADAIKEQLRLTQGQLAVALADVAALRSQLQAERTAANERERELTRDIARLHSRGTY